MEPNSTPAGGLLNSLRRTGRSLLALVHNRLDLASVEWQEEKIRVLYLLLQAAAVAVLGTLFLLMLLALVVYALWQVSPWLALGLPTVLFGLAAAVLFGNMKQRLKTEPRPFTETIG
ncbi:MAG TPA: phage holin family protein, partial [Verrucomicrobiae bacterium]|nr:phage holin family protein [Verrucomicrobiae bacterium]